MSEMNALKRSTGKRMSKGICSKMASKGLKRMPFCAVEETALESGIVLFVFTRK